jgi:hypothetical protein
LILLLVVFLLTAKVEVESRRGQIKFAKTNPKICKEEKNALDYVYVTGILVDNPLFLEVILI